MKIKLDFVTNSSSTSFCVWGMKFNSRDCDVDGIPSLYGVTPDYLPEEVLKRSYQHYLNNNKDGGMYHERCRYSNTGHPNEVREVTYDFFRRKIREFDYDFTEYIVNYLYNHGLESIFSCESELVIIGKSPFDIPDDKTPREYKESIKKSFEEAGFDKNNICLDTIQKEVNT